METNGVKQMQLDPGEMKVHAIKLNHPAKNPAAAPAPTPSTKIPVRINRNLSQWHFATRITVLGLEPKGVKHMMTSSASKMENCTIFN
ncbi:MAG: hypothetical protein ACLTE2_08740 [Eubacteriales bacterium]